MRKARIGMVVALAIALAALGAQGVLAQPEDARPLVHDTPLSGTLAGNRAGSFHYYTIDYPGDGRAVTIQMTFTPADPVTKTEVGFNVYGREGFEIGAAEHNGDGTAGHATLVYADNVPATWLVQVYNYSPVTTINYEIVARGLPAPQPTPAATPAEPIPGPTPVPGQLAAGQTVSGSLVGTGAGAFARYGLVHPGDGTQRTITVTFAGAHGGAAEAIGFDLYGPQGQHIEPVTTDVAFQYRATVSPTAAGAWLIQVHNYAQNLPVTYTVTVQ
jgi:hypothetical protein